MNDNIQKKKKKVTFKVARENHADSKRVLLPKQDAQKTALSPLEAEFGDFTTPDSCHDDGDHGSDTSDGIDDLPSSEEAEDQDWLKDLAKLEKETIIVPRKKMEAGNRGRPSILQPVCPAPSEPSPVSGLPSADKATLPADNHVPEEEEAFKCRPCDNNNDNQALDKNLAEVSVVRDISVDPEMAVVDEEGKARASLLILLNQEERNGIKLRLRSNKMASDLSEERSKRLKLQKALIAAQRQQGRVESQTRVEELQGAVDHLNESFLAQTAKNQTLSSKMHFLQVRADRLASELREKQQQYFLLEARQVDSEKLLSESQARVDELRSVIDEQNRKLQRQTAEKHTFSSQMKSVLEENSAKDALLASLNSRANKLICDIAEEKDKSLGFQSELEAALSDKTKAIGEAKRLGQELRQTEEECEKLSKQLDSRNQQRQEKTLALEKSLVHRHVTSPSLEAEQELSDGLAAKLEIMQSKSQATIREQEEQISQLRDSLLKETSSRQALMEEHQGVKAQLSDLLDRVKAEAKVESQHISPQLMELKKQVCDKKLALEKSLTSWNELDSSLKSQRAYFEKLQTKNHVPEEEEAFKCRPCDNNNDNQALDKNLAEVSVVRDISVDPEMAVVDEEGKARASLLNLLNQEERNGIKLRLRSNKMTSDLSEERSKRLKLQKALIAAQRQQGRVESQTRVEELQGAVDHLNESFLAQMAKNQTLSSKMHFLQVRADRLASELTEKQQQYFLLEARQVDSEKLLSESQARVDELRSVIDEQNRKLQRQTAEKHTFSSQMKSVLEENSAKDALLASLNSRANKLICDIAEEKDKSLGFQSELEAALSDKTKAIGEAKRLGQELRQTEEKCEKLSKQLDSRNQQRQEKTLALEKSLVHRHVTSPSLEAEQENSDGLAAKLEIMQSKSQATIIEQEEQISQLRDSLLKEASSRQALMEEHQGVKAQLSDLLDRVKAQAKVESQLISPQLMELKKQVCDKKLALEKSLTSWNELDSSLKSQRAYFEKLQTKNQTKMSKLKTTVRDLEAILRLRFTEMHDLTVQNKTLWTEGKLVLARKQKVEEKYELLLVDHRYLQAVLDTNHRHDLNTSLKAQAQSSHFDMLLSDNQSKLSDCHKAVHGLEKILKTLQSNNHTLQASLNGLETDHHILLGKYNTLLKDKYFLQSVTQRDMPRVGKTI